MYKKAYQNLEGSRGLYYLIDPTLINLRATIIDHWKTILCSDTYQFIGPTLVPKQVLEKSGHLKEFGDEIFSVDGSLCLRPETAQSLFINLKSIRRELKGFPLKVYQVGRAYRNEKSTRDGAMRKKEFEQLELHILGPKDYPFKELYLPLLEQFFKTLNLTYSIKTLSAEERPHYSQLTMDLYHKDVEIGCVNYRGAHDLESFTEKERELYSIYEISLGLDRLISFLKDL